MIKTVLMKSLLMNNNMKIMKFKTITILCIIGYFLFNSCGEKIICNYYLNGRDIYALADSSLKFRISANPTSLHKFSIEEKSIPPNGFAIPVYSELKTLVDGIKNCKQIDLPALFPNSIKLVSNTDTFDYEGNKLLKGFVLTEKNGTIEVQEVMVDRGELVTIIYKKL
jgi:hypothetical protein